ncbi:LexA family transcriptional regulator [Gemella massiliensis]|uniref:LexA family transcriptional regulator n=1 Tax=Gemella massiliensis TaxID=1909670 RepID=UPI0009301BE2|nr:XRE family transcriptional regulator [Gemella massiliensis]
MNNKTSIEKRLKEIMLIRNINLSKLSDISKISKSSLHSYLKGKNKPKQNNIYKLSMALNVPEAYLMGWTDDINSSNNSLLEKINNNVIKLNSKNQNKTLNYTNELLNSQNKSIGNNINENIGNEDITEILVTEKAAAGTGYSYYGEESEIYYTSDDVPNHDFATRITGDSMSPKLLDGDIALISAGYDGVNGQIYLVDYDGKSFIKKVYNEGTRYVLRSINPKYDDIILYLTDLEDIYFNIIGRVIKSVTPVQK